MKLERRSLLAGLVFAVLGAASIKAVDVADKRIPSLQYVPPACQGKPLAVVPRAEALAQTPTKVETNPEIAKSDQLKVFDALAKIIEDVYVDPDFNGQNWAGIIAAFRARVTSGLDTATFYAEMEKFVGRLGDEHSYFESPVRVAANKASLAGVNSYAGIGALFKPMPEKKRVAILAVFPIHRRSTRVCDSTMHSWPLTVCRWSKKESCINSARAAPNAPSQCSQFNLRDNSRAT